MASSRNIVETVKWAVIGTNAYVFCKWRLFLPPPEAKQGGKVDKTSHAYRIAQLEHQRYMFDHYTLTKRNIDEGRWQILLTASCSHIRLGHFALNMFMLHQATVFATMVGLAPLPMGALALGSALTGSLGSLYDTTQRVAAGEPDTPSLGASGMVQGMLVATMLAAPRLPVYVFFIPIPVAYRTFVGGFLAWDMYNLYEERTQGGRSKGWDGSYTGYAAHLGGALFGAGFYLVAMRKGRAVPFKRRR